MDRQKNKPMNTGQAGYRDVAQKEYFQKETAVFWPCSIRRDGLGKSLITGTVEARKTRDRPAISWLKDIHIWTGKKLPKATRATSDVHRRSRKLVMATLALLALLTEEEDIEGREHTRC